MFCTGLVGCGLGPWWICEVISSCRQRGPTLKSDIDRKQDVLLMTAIWEEDASLPGTELGVQACDCPASQGPGALGEALTRLPHLCKARFVT